MALTAIDLSTLSRLLDAGIELAAGEVEGWLRSLPAEHVHLVPELRSMLAERAGCAGFLAAGPRLAADDTVASAGDRVGPYRLVRELGQGGMGTVWLAEQVDGRLSRHVALKLPRLAWGSGLKERMARERDIGALLEHPSIARLYDAGVDEKGRPYLALEYIDGVPLDRWCADRDLSLDDRLRLFLQVARAVAYAHGRLVVHRDLKPSNVIVTGDGQPHLLDFGIAKLVDDASGSGPTQDQGRVMTPRYASPEQVRGETVTVASDIYSLGVLLFELLSGHCPDAPSATARASGPAPDDEPALCSSKAADCATARRLKGELDAIVSMAMRCDPARRYPTAAAFAADVTRHLHGEPVVARPDSAAQRLHRAARRHRSGIGAAAVVALAIVTGSAIAAIQATRAGRSAERERLVKEFVAELFRANAKSDGAAVKTRRSASELMLEKGAALIEARFPDQPELQSELYGVVSGVFGDMGAYALAVDYGRKQLATMAGTDAPADRRLRAVRRVSEALLLDGQLEEADKAVRSALAADMGDEQRKPLAVLSGRIGVARGEFAEVARAVALARTLRAPESIDDAWLEWVEANVLVSQNRIEAAMKGFEAALETGVRIAGAEARDVAELRLQWGFWLSSNSRDVEATTQIRSALAVLERGGEASAIRAAATRAYFAWYLTSVTGPEGLSAVRDARAFVERSSVVVPDVIVARLDFYEGQMLLFRGDVDAAEALLATSVPTLLRLLQSPLEAYYVRVAQTRLLIARGQHERARALMAERHRLRRLAGQGDTAWSFFDYADQVRNETLAGEYEGAERLLAGAPRTPANPADALGYALPQTLLWERVRIHLQRGEAAAARILAEGLTVGAAADPMPVGDRALLAESLCADGRSREGLLRAREAISIRLRYSGATAKHPMLARERAVAGNCAMDIGDRPAALRMVKEAAAAFEEQPLVSDYYKQPLRRLAGRLKLRLGPAVG